MAAVNANNQLNDSGFAHCQVESVTRCTKLAMSGMVSWRMAFSIAAFIHDECLVAWNATTQFSFVLSDRALGLGCWHSIAPVQGIILDGLFNCSFHWACLIDWSQKFSLSSIVAMPLCLSGAFCKFCLLSKQNDLNRMVYWESKPSSRMFYNGEAILKFLYRVHRILSIWNMKDSCSFDQLWNRRTYIRSPNLMCMSQSCHWCVVVMKTIAHIKRHKRSGSC